jgi:hypothetical protein
MFRYLNDTTGKTKWNVCRLEERVRNRQVKKAGKEASEEQESEAEPDLGLADFFEQANFSDLTEPTTILDCFGRVMVWALPDVLHQNRLVCQLNLHICFIINFLHRQTFTKRYQS